MSAGSPLDRGGSRTRLPSARASVRALRAYSPDAAPCAIDLSDNTNLFGAPPAAMRVLRDATHAALTRYPSLSAIRLREALAAHHRVPVECVVTGCGSDDVLDAALRAFAGPGERIAYHDPTFSMIPIMARINGLDPAPIACPGAVDPGVVTAMFETRPRMIYLCGPNNPTGAGLGPGAIETARHELRRAAGADVPLLVFDQAYAEFDEPDGTPERHVSLDDPVLVTRTLSKAFGLAGLRVGYGIGPPEIVAEVEKARGPYKVNALGERAGVAALTDDLDWVRARVADVRELRERLAASLRELGYSPLPSAANFVLVPVRNAAATAASLRAAGVAVRPFTGLEGIGDALRITIGPWPMLDTCLAALREARP